MRIDMHCHTKEGSIDGRITIQEYVSRLKELGFNGMVVTDHNSYGGWRSYQKDRFNPVFKDFVVLKGIEYDTSDGGHILIIMPKNVTLPILEIRGLPVKLLIQIVHAFHGILGPAHPFGEKYMSIGNSKYYKKHPEILNEFDFMEIFNSCITEESNRISRLHASIYSLPGTAGSDAHKLNCVGLAHTDFSRNITKESELIQFLKEAREQLRNPNTAKSISMSVSGELYSGTSRNHLGLMYDLALRLWNIYSKFSNYHKRNERKEALEDISSTFSAL